MFKARDTSSCISGLEQDESLAYMTRKKKKKLLLILTWVQVQVREGD